MVTEFELEVDKKSNSKEWTQFFCNKISASDFCTVVHRFFFPTCHALKKWFELSGVTLYGNNLKGNKNYFEVSGRFELSRVGVIRSLLYSHKVTYVAF